MNLQKDVRVGSMWLIASETSFLKSGIVIKVEDIGLRRFAGHKNMLWAATANSPAGQVVIATRTLQICGDYLNG